MGVILTSYDPPSGTILYLPTCSDENQPSMQVNIPVQWTLYIHDRGLYYPVIWGLLINQAGSCKQPILLNGDTYMDYAVTVQRPLTMKKPPLMGMFSPLSVALLVFDPCLLLRSSNAGQPSVGRLRTSAIPWTRSSKYTLSNLRSSRPTTLNGASSVTAATGHW